MAQQEARHLAKVKAAGSIPVVRSLPLPAWQAPAASSNLATATLRRWRNGIRARLRSVCLQGHEGSNPSPRTKKSPRPLLPWPGSLGRRTRRGRGPVASRHAP